MKATNMYRTIVTKYLGPTNFRGSRIKVQWGDHRQGDRTKNVHWKSELNAEDNHAQAAMEFAKAVMTMDLEHLELIGGGTTTGAVFAIRYSNETQIGQAARQAAALLEPIERGERGGAAMGMASTARDLLLQALA